MTRILITGSNGFVGQHLLKKLSAAGYEIRCLQRKNCLAVKDFPNIYEPQIMETNFVPHGIVHLAGLAHISPRHARKHKLSFAKSNGELTRKIVEFAKSRDVKIFINLSSIAVLVGSSSKTVINDNSIPNPRTPYAKSKYIGEIHVKGLQQENRLVVSLRPPLIIGAGAKGNWASLIRLASTRLPLPFANIENSRSFIGIDDLCDRIICVLSQEPSGRKSGEYCVASETALSLQEIVHEIRAARTTADSMFAVPFLLWKIIDLVPGVSPAVKKLTANLILDDRQFCDAFQYRNRHFIKQQIRKSVALSKITCKVF